MCAEIGRGAGRNKRWPRPNAAFSAKTRGRTKVLPLAACADAQLAPGSCLHTTWRGQARSRPFASRIRHRNPMGRPIVANLNLSLSLTRRQALWLGPANQLGAVAIVPAV